jgi:hypothetical protein
MDTFELGGHTDSVVGLTFNAAGSFLATASLDAGVRIWNTSGGGPGAASAAWAGRSWCCGCLPARHARACAAACAPAGPVSHRRAARLVRADGSLLRSLEGPGEGIEWVCWHPKGDVVLAGSEDCSMWMWLAQSGNCMQVGPGRLVGWQRVGRRSLHQALPFCAHGGGKGLAPPRRCRRGRGTRVPCSPCKRQLRTCTLLTPWTPPFPARHDRYSQATRGRWWLAASRLTARPSCQPGARGTRACACGTQRRASARSLCRCGQGRPCTSSLAQALPAAPSARRQCRCRTTGGAPPRSAGAAWRRSAPWRPLTPRMSAAAGPPLPPRRPDLPGGARRRPGGGDGRGGRLALPDQHLVGARGGHPAGRWVARPPARPRAAAPNPLLVALAWLHGAPAGRLVMMLTLYHQILNYLVDHFSLV